MEQLETTLMEKKVLRLEYEAYEAMAEKELRLLCDKIRSKWNVKRIAIIHRIGVVQVGEASVAIAVSSEHRREALEAVHFAINELKARVPIWKKEWYIDGSQWKQNAEYDNVKVTVSPLSACTHDHQSTNSHDHEIHKTHSHSHSHNTHTDNKKTITDSTYGLSNFLILSLGIFLGTIITKAFKSR